MQKSTLTTNSTDTSLARTELTVSGVSFFSFLCSGSLSLVDHIIALQLNQGAASITLPLPFWSEVGMRR